jgi:hypothetical protein
MIDSLKIKLHIQTAPQSLLYPSRAWIHPLPHQSLSLTQTVIIGCARIRPGTILPHKAGSDHIVFHGPTSILASTASVSRWTSARSCFLFTCKASAVFLSRQSCTAVTLHLNLVHEKKKVKKLSATGSQKPNTDWYSLTHLETPIEFQALVFMVNIPLHHSYRTFIY